MNIEKCTFKRADCIGCEFYLKKVCFKLDKINPSKDSLLKANLRSLAPGIPGELSCEEGQAEASKQWDATLKEAPFSGPHKCRDRACRTLKVSTYLNSVLRAPACLILVLP